MQNIQLIHGNCETEIQKLPDESVDVILTDPPYLYLKNQKWDKPFNEDLLFSEWKRVLKDTGMVVMFGRGESFYRWNYKLAQLGFKFKEEIVWYKNNGSSPIHRLVRRHESIYIATKKKGKIRRSKVPYMEQRGFEIEKIFNDLDSISKALNKPQKIEEIREYLKTKIIPYKKAHSFKHVGTLAKCGLKQNREVTYVKSIEEGMNETSVIRVAREERDYEHTTQKPVRLMERLLNIVVEPNTNAMVLDTFAGSGSVAIASYNLGHSFIGYELDEEFYTKAKSRIEKHIADAERAKQCETQSLAF